MKAIILKGLQQVELQDVPIPIPGPGELLVKVRAATTCGTDLKIYRRGHPKFPPPLTFGHEFSGEIVDLGSGVTRFAIGMPITANVFGECGKCFFCQAGQGNLCENLEYNFGAFAEYHLIPASIVRENTFLIPPQISYSEAAIVEPLVCVVHAFNLINIRPDENVVVIGAGGPISLLFIQLIRLAGARKVIAIGHSDKRLSVAMELGADVVVNAKKEAQRLIVQELTGGYGPDVVIECAGKEEAWTDAIKIVRRGGRVLWFGGLPGGTEVPINAARVHYDEISLLNSHGGTAKDAAAAMDLISSGKVKVDPLITHEMRLSEIETALQLMASGEAIKVALIP